MPPQSSWTDVCLKSHYDTENMSVYVYRLPLKTGAAATVGRGFLLPLSPSAFSSETSASYWTSASSYHVCYFLHNYTFSRLWEALLVVWLDGNLMITLFLINLLITPFLDLNLPIDLKWTLSPTCSSVFPPLFYHHQAQHFPLISFPTVPIPNLSESNQPTFFFIMLPVGVWENYAWFYWPCWTAAIHFNG